MRLVSQGRGLRGHATFPDLQDATIAGRDRTTFSHTIGNVKVEVRATGLKAMREKRGLTQRKLAHDLGISQNYIPAIEAGARHAGPKLQQQMLKYFRCDFAEV